MNLIGVDNIYDKYDRKVTSFLDVVANIGGMTEAIFSLVFIFTYIFAKPYRELQLALAYQEIYDEDGDLS